MRLAFTREMKIGIMVIVGLTALIFGINYLKGINIFTPSNSYYIKYQNIGSLEKSAAVKIQGYKVGQIRDIIYNFEKKEPFTVIVSLDTDLRIPVGSTAELIDDGLLGSKIVQIVFNKESKEYYMGGDTIPSKIRVSVLSNIQETVIPQVQHLIPQIDSLIMAVRALSENKSITNTLRSLEYSAQNLEETSKGLKEIMNSNMPAILGNVDIIAGNLANTSIKLNKVDFAHTVAGIDSAMNNIKSITEKINNNKGSLGLLINDKSLYNSLDSTATNANLLMIDLKKRPSRYVHVSVFGKSEKE